MFARLQRDNVIWLRLDYRSCPGLRRLAFAFSPTRIKDRSNSGSSEMSYKALLLDQVEGCVSTHRET